MKIKLCFPRPNSMKISEIEQIEFLHHEPCYEELVSYTDHKINCLVYLDDSGGLLKIDSQSKLKKVTKEYSSCGQNTLIILVENIKNFDAYTSSSNSSWPQTEDGGCITLDNPDLIIEVIDFPKSKEMLKRYRTYKIEWKVKNIGDSPLIGMKCHCADDNIKIVSFNMSDLKVNEEGFVKLEFKYVDSKPKKWKKTVIKLTLFNQILLNQISECVVQNDRFLKYEVEFEPDKSYLDLKEIMKIEEKLIINALGACEGDPNAAFEHLLDHGNQTS